MKILVTNSGGFTGKYLVPYLQRNPENTVIPYDGDCIEELEEVISSECPKEIYHLRGSFTDCYAIDHVNNVLATYDILRLARDYSARVLLIGSAAEYGNTPSPIKETDPLNPSSVYGLTKVMQSQIMQFAFKEWYVDVVMARTFNLYGKGISPTLFVGSLYSQITELKEGRRDKIILENLEAYRDYLHIEGAIQLYEMIMTFGEPGEIYNVGSGYPTKVYDIMVKILKEENIPLDVVKQDLRVCHRKNEPRQIYADISKINTLRLRAEIRALKKTIKELNSGRNEGVNGQSF